MNGIILVTVPAEAGFIEVKLPVNLTADQFNSVMNRIKMDFFGEVKPKLVASKNSFAVTTYDTDETNAILTESACLNTIKDLVNQLGNPLCSTNWIESFWNGYRTNNPVVKQILLVLRTQFDAETEQYLRENNLQWLADFISSLRIK